MRQFILRCEQRQTGHGGVERRIGACRLTEGNEALCFNRSGGPSGNHRRIPPISERRLFMFSEEEN